MRNTYLSFRTLRRSSSPPTSQVMIIIFLLLSALRVKALPTPSSFGPNALPPAPNWLIFGRAASDNPNSDDRTLIDIIRSCVLTIAACVYRAIHPNIPKPEPEPEGNCWIRKPQFGRLKVTVYALLAPEMIIFWAIRQWMGARLIVKQVNEALENTDSGITWTMAHGHFAQMGGFCREGNERVIFAPELIELIKHGHVNLKGLRLKEKDIYDRSKGDYLSQGFITLQTTWFILECVTRWIKDLPLAELEVITLAYATLNIATFLIWLTKPLNVNRPNYLEIYNSPPSVEDEPASTTDKTRVCSWSEVTSGLHWGTEEHLIGIIFPRMRDLLHKGQKPQDPRPKRFLPRVLLTIFENLLKRPFCHIFAPPLDLVDDSATPRDATHVSCFYAMKIEPLEWWRMWYPSCFIAILFGAIHFAAWDSHFPTQTEQTLWRISTVILVVVPFDLLVMGVAFHAHDRWGKDMEDWTRITLQVVCFVLAVFSMAFGLMIYALARVCLTVQAIIALRAVPPGLFTGFVWTSVLPHF
ncbi:hypothetical protein BDN72DRAFT_838379 [Pluteus cervinus]|uniref:Uncharacterized protein n=1 Tax=Pluteus cervinus TaxID=181527 RepID=A0ACD3B0T3_9AGAR|nr:hypothetical protein BDN72DRAFT_838379 [Pluteus cervinus]